MGSRKKRPGAASRYFHASRSLAASYVFVLPFLGLYQLALAFDDGVRNGTAPLLREFFQSASRAGLLVANLVLLGLLLLAIARTRARRLHVRGLYGVMLAESAAWAAFMMAIAVLVVTPRLLALPPLPRRLIAYAGAGIYEEVLFRFLLMGGLILLLRRAMETPTVMAVPLACAASAALFSYAHHALGGQPFAWGVFGYRMVMGLILGTAFWLRGLGIVVYAHAFYNVSLVLWQEYVQNGGGA